MTATVCQSAVRAWVEPKLTKSPRSGQPYAVGGKHTPIGQRALVFDTETATDYAMAPLYGFFQIRERDELVLEGIIEGDGLGTRDGGIIREFARAIGLEVVSRARFVDEYFYPEVYQLGTLCVGFNLPFDLTRLPVHVGSGRGKHRNAFSLRMSENTYWPRVRIEAVSARAAFIGFAPVKRLYRDFFKGRFLDLKTLVNALTGESHSLRSAGEAFDADVIKGELDQYGLVNEKALAYARNDVAATWSLYVAARKEYARYTFATFENELDRAGYQARRADDPALLRRKRRQGDVARDGDQDAARKTTRVPT
jgi:hypothetical protein